MFSLWPWSNTTFSCQEAHELLEPGRKFWGSTSLHLPYSYIFFFWPLSETGSGQERPFIWSIRSYIFSDKILWTAQASCWLCNVFVSQGMRIPFVSTHEVMHATWPHLHGGIMMGLHLPPESCATVWGSCWALSNRLSWHAEPDGNPLSPDVRGPPVWGTSPVWPMGGTAAERGHGGATHTTHAAAKDHEAEAEWVRLLLLMLESRSATSTGGTGVAGTSASTCQGSHSFGHFVKLFFSGRRLISCSHAFHFPLKMRQSDHLLDFFCVPAIANIGFYFCKHTKKKQLLRGKRLIYFLTSFTWPGLGIWRWIYLWRALVPADFIARS